MSNYKNECMLFICLTLQIEMHKYVKIFTSKVSVKNCII